MPTQSVKNHFNRGTIVLLGIIIFLSVILFIFKEPIYSKMLDLKLIPLPERFTEIYFANSNLLPSTVEKGKAISFAFVIHNVEGKDTSYMYDVYDELNGTKTFLTHGTAFIKDNASQLISETITASSQNRQEIVVTLLNKNQRIGFWIGE